MTLFTSNMLRENLQKCGSVLTSTICSGEEVESEDCYRDDEIVLQIHSVQINFLPVA